MALGPIVQGQTAPAWTIQVLRSDSSPLPITGATFTGTLFNLKSGTKKALTVGAFVITDGTNGLYTYSPQATDVDTPGVWGFETVLTIGGLVYIPRTTVQIDPAWGA